MKTFSDGTRIAFGANGLTLQLSCVYDVTQWWQPSEEKCVSTIRCLYDETKATVRLGNLWEDDTRSYGSVL